MLWGKTLRSSRAHARIIKIDTVQAERLPGVRAVLTHRDIPGLNGFGMVKPHWPGLCRDRVRCRGDALALVAAESEIIAEEAINLIEVAYQPLPVIEEPVQSLGPEAFPIHVGGNCLVTREIIHNHPGRKEEETDLRLTGSYRTQFQDHVFLEPPGGLAVYNPEEDTITIWCGDQHPHGIQLQVARSLGWVPERIRVIGSPTGGAFGGKIEVTAQIHLALLAFHTRSPVYLR